ncbi:hypothetical protein BH739_01245 [Enterococcus casseliflavus]|nr:hypothetical protein BH739_01245 [Enterococcus casseliflavus]
MISKSDLISMGFKPNQASKMVKEAKEYLVNVKGIELYDNRQLSVVPARTIEEIFHLKVCKKALQL